MLVSRPLTSGTPCLAARAARYFLLISPNGCATKLTFTPGCACSNSGMTVSMDVLSKYQTVRTLSSDEVVGEAGPQALASNAAPTHIDDNCTHLRVRSALLNIVE